MSVKNALAGFSAGYNLMATSRQNEAAAKQRQKQQKFNDRLQGILGGQPAPMPQTNQLGTPPINAPQDAAPTPTPAPNALAAPPAPSAPGQAMPQGAQPQNGLNPAQPQADDRYSQAANAAFQFGDHELGMKLHEIHMQTKEAQRIAQTQEGKQKEQGLRRMKDMLLVAKNNPDMFDRVKQFAAQLGIEGVEDAQPGQIDGTIAMVEAVLSDPDNNTVLKDGETIFNQATGKVVYSNRAHEVEAQGDNLQAFNPVDGTFGNTQTRGQTFEEQEANRSNLADEANTQFSNQTDRFEANTERLDTENEIENGGADASFGLTPVYGRDADGNRILIQTNKAGGVRQAELPDGVTLEDDAYRTAAKNRAAAVVKNQFRESKIQSSIATTKQKMDMMLSDIDKAAEQSNWTNTGVVGRFNPLQGSQDFRATLKSLQARIGFGELQEMRDNSPTGGALGQVSEKEIDFLQRLKGSIDTIQSENQLDGNLERIKGEIQASYKRLNDAYEKDKADGLFGSEGQGKNTALYNKYGLE